MSDTLIDLIRHGEPVGGRRYRGNGCDDPLSDVGWQQMWEAVGSLGEWKQVISSPMQRCRAFAAELGAQRGLPVTIDERLREVGFGRWEGLSPAELRDCCPEEYDAFQRDPVRYRPPRAEPLAEFSSRVNAAVAEAAASHGGARLLIVAHAGVIRASVGHVLNAPAERWYRIRVRHAGITRIRYDDYGSALEFHNAPHC
jgi:probable phosphoglycerate mutase